MLTFKQYLNEFTVDIDSETNPQDQLQAVRKTQLMMKKSPERVIRTQIQNAQNQKAAAAKSTASTAALEAKIAKQKEQLARDEQRLMMLKKKQTLNTPAPGDPLPGT